MARYQVRGPHGYQKSYAKWTVVDTLQDDMAVDVHRTKADAVDAAREMNHDQSV